jgi:hypothetical protein
MVATTRALICLVDPVDDGFNPARLLAEKKDQLATGGVDQALQCMLAGVINTYEDVVEWLEESSDTLAGALFHALDHLRIREPRHVEKHDGGQPHGCAHLPARAQFGCRSGHCRSP